MCSLSLQHLSASGAGCDVPFPFLDPHRVFSPPLMAGDNTLSCLAFSSAAATYLIV